ncbi:Glutamate synthase (NADPH) large chain [Candidatus Magnetaquicoccaceae bacterium FCR-1]|uniref:Glutamate synthase (NADPH) large chain n=1 Tax=Candidatus Magnetaquiglobus chichijimensis TaxID=3141448 RepID=A0ABQ0CBD5_9PROT
MANFGLPEKQGLYDPALEHDACGVGFVARINGGKSHDVVRMGLSVLVNLTHRGAVGSDPLTGDGAGILIQIPDAFLRAQTAKIGITLPPEGDYGVGMIFLPKDKGMTISCQRLVEQVITEEGQLFLGWRTVPVSRQARIGYTAKGSEPAIRQVFIGVRNRPDNADPMWFERKLYIIRRRVENAVLGYGQDEVKSFYISSFSSRTLVYKGMFLADQVRAYYTDLSDASLVSAFAMVHQRYSTNTFPTWGLAHPFRMISHNGEINTLRGNINWMRAREAALSSGLFGEDIKKLFPIVPEGLSDSASFDRALEFLVISGRSLPHAMMMMIPEAWENHRHMDEDRKAFYQYHGALMEPWDGPAAVAFTDGRYIGATLDRNGLRPARYLITKGGLCVMASEAGTITFPPEEEVKMGRLQPGRMFVIDMQEGRIIDDAEIKQTMVSRQPYRQWIDENLTRLDTLPAGGSEVSETEPLRVRQRIFGYTEEDLSVVLGPMAADGQEPIGSMGNDAALAVLSDRPVLLYGYFKQLFAQVTNPAIDPIREELVMSLFTQLGPTGNMLEESPQHVARIWLEQPILTNADLEKIRAVERPGLKARTISTLFAVEEGAEGMKAALTRLFETVSAAVDQGVSLIVLSDRGVSAAMAPIPALLAVSGVHHHLIRSGTRGAASIVIETGEAREVTHCALLAGYGAGAINPYLAFESLEDLVARGILEAPKGMAYLKANYVKAIGKGMLKIFSKMGISTLRSYCGAQIFEAIGLSRRFLEKHFTGTFSRLDGVGLLEVARETLERHRRAFTSHMTLTNSLDIGGEYTFRHEGERHMWTPDTIAKLQQSTRTNDYPLYKEFATLINQQDRAHCTLRGLFQLKEAEEPLPLAEVEPASEIVKRFVTGAMSFGSISKEAHETLAIAMNRLGGRSNTGEGGEDPERYKPRPNGDLARSAIKQVAAGRFGVSSHYLANADEMQIKVAQGAKPGEGGQLPGHKVTETVARIRNTTPGVMLISPPPHHDIYSIEDLAQLIFDLKNVNPRARVSVKLVSEVGVGTVAAGVAKGHADMILVSGGDGGTGASPMSSIKHAGAPWELGLAETQQTLVLNDLRGRVRLQTDGQLRTGRDVVVAALLGAEEFGFATAPLVVSGCVMMRKCHLDSCPVGVATQDLELRKKFTGRPQHLVNYFYFVANEAREIMARMGFKSIDEMIGQSDHLLVNEAVTHWKAKGLDLLPLLEKPDAPSNVATRCVQAQDHGIDKVLDHQLLDLASRVFESLRPIEIRLPIQNTDRAVGAMLGGEISRLFGAEGLPRGTIKCYFEGVAGQSFGAFNVQGVSLYLEGAANDYVGKGMSGGRIVIRPHPRSPLVAEENIIAGNTLLYGATGGIALMRGVVGERFAVRNSGARAVVEGVGDHGCEYMTGGVVVVLGATGRNFAAGMSGGIAYVLDESGRFPSLCNTAMVGLEPVSDAEDREVLKELVEEHARYTDSQVAARLLKDWDAALGRFVKVMPHDYRRVLEEQKKREQTGNG